MNKLGGDTVTLKQFPPFHLFCFVFTGAPKKSSGCSLLKSKIRLWRRTGGCEGRQCTEIRILLVSSDKILTQLSLSKINSNIAPGAQTVLPTFGLLFISHFCFLLCWPYYLAGWEDSGKHGNSRFTWSLSWSQRKTFSLKALVKILRKTLIGLL